MKRGFTLLLSVAALALVWTSPALAGGHPATGKYHCATGYWLKIKSADHYKFSVGDGGKYAYKSASHKIVFKSGYLSQDWYGGYRKDSQGNPIIDLFLKDDSGDDSCYR
jgi:hypothetical protein